MMNNELQDKAFRKIEDEVERALGIPNLGSVEGKPMDVFEFLKQNPPGVELFQSEKTILKIFYGLPLNGTDKKELEWLKAAKGIDVKLLPKHELVLCCGRRSGKSTLIAIIVVYELYLMHQFADPYAKFNVMRDTPLDIICCSASADQAEDLQDKIRAYLRNVAYFQPFIDTLDKTKEMRIFTRRDVESGAEKGSLRIVSKHSLSRTVRGWAAFCVIMDELAHFIDNKGNFSGDSMYTALTPSVKTFGNYGKVFSMSSPLAESGKFYDLTRQADKVDSMLYVNYATWEFNPGITKESLDDEFQKDPEGALREYGAVFGAVIAGFLPAEKVDAMVDPNMAIQLVGNPSKAYALCVDPSKSLDRYVVGWGHAEYRMIGNEQKKVAVIDGLKAWESEKYRDANGKWIRKNVDIEGVENFIINLHSRRNFRVGIIAYDQYQNISSIQKFQKLGLNAQETTFTGPYKERIYGTLLSCLLSETVKMYGKDSPEQENLPWALAELKSIQRELKGKAVHIGHPKSGPVQNDDYADVIANLTHLLITEGEAGSKFAAPTRVRPLVARSSLG